MKIEPGDLCITRTTSTSPHALRNSGRLVIARKFEGPNDRVGPNTWRCECLGEPLVDVGGKLWPEPLIDARNLRPIRDQPGEDETLTWKEKEHA